MLSVSLALTTDNLEASSAYDGASSSHRERNLAQVSLVMSGKALVLMFFW